MHGGCDKVNTVEKTIKKRKSDKKRIRKKPDGFKTLFMDLFGSTLEDLETERPKAKKIEVRRHTLPVSISIPDEEFLKPLKISQKRKSENDVNSSVPSKLQKVEEPAKISQLPHQEFLIVQLLAKAEDESTSLEPVTVANDASNTAVIFDRPEVREADDLTIVEQSVAPSTSDIIDLTDDGIIDFETFLQSYTGPEQVKAETAEASSSTEKAKAPAQETASMPLLDEPTETEATISMPSQVGNIQTLTLPGGINISWDLSTLAPKTSTVSIEADGTQKPLHPKQKQTPLTFNKKDLAAAKPDPAQTTGCNPSQLILQNTQNTSSHSTVHNLAVLCSLNGPQQKTTPSESAKERVACNQQPLPAVVPQLPTAVPQLSVVAPQLPVVVPLLPAVVPQLPALAPAVSEPNRSPRHVDRESLTLQALLQPSNREEPTAKPKPKRRNSNPKGNATQGAKPANKQRGRPRKSSCPNVNVGSLMPSPEQRPVPQPNQVPGNGPQELDQRLRATVSSVLLTAQHQAGPQRQVGPQPGGLPRPIAPRPQVAGSQVGLQRQVGAPQQVLGPQQVGPQLLVAGPQQPVVGPQLQVVSPPQQVLGIQQQAAGPQPPMSQLQQLVEKQTQIMCRVMGIRRPPPLPPQQQPNNRPIFPSYPQNLVLGPQARNENSRPICLPNGQIPAAPRLIPISMSSPLAPRVLLTNETLAKKLFDYLVMFDCWKHMTNTFQDSALKGFSSPMYKHQINIFRAYCGLAMSGFGKKLLEELCYSTVENFDFNTVLGLMEKGSRLNRVRICMEISLMIEECAEDCKTPFTKLFFNIIDIIKRRLQSRAMGSFTETQIVSLKKQIMEYHLISKWLVANQANKQKTVVPQQAQPQPGDLRTVRKQQAAQSTIPEIPIQSQPTTNSNNEVLPRLEVVTSETRNPHSARTVPTQNRRTNDNLISVPANNQISTHDELLRSSEALNRFSEEPAIPLTPPEPTSAQAERASPIAIEADAFIDLTDADAQYGDSSSDESVVETPIKAEEDSDIKDIKPHVMVKTDDDVIDLTWIEDGDEMEILQELQECKVFPLKIEIFEENEADPHVRETISPADSGLGSPQAPEPEGDHVGFEQVENEVSRYKCLCGNAATSLCDCKIAMYCSRECQLQDWEGDHRRWCPTLLSQQMNENPNNE